MFKRSLVLLLWFIGSFTSTAWAVGSQSVYELPVGADDLSLAKYFWVWEDTTAGAKFLEAQRAYQRGQFQELGEGFASYGFTSSAYWFRAGIKNTLNIQRNLILSVPQPLLDRVDVYCQLNQGRTYYYPLGEQTDFERRRLKVRHYAIPLTLLPSSQIDCFFRVETTSNLIMDLRVSDADSFLEKESRTQWLSGLFYGVACSFLLAVFFLYVVMREPVYLYYFVHIVGGLGYSSLADGTLSGLWSFLDVENFAPVFFIACWMIGALLFVVEFLMIKQTYQKLYAGVLGAIYTLLLLLAFYPWVPEIDVASTMIHLVSAYTFIVLGIGFMCLFNGDRQARFFVIGWGAVSVTIGLAQLAAMGAIYDYGFTTVGIKVGWVIEIVIFSIVLGLRLTLMKRRERRFQKGMVTAQDENSEKSQFLAKMSHEIRTPMSGILGLAELLETTPLSATQMRYLKAIQDSGKSMMNVVNGVLDVSKIEAGKATLTNNPIDVKALLLDCLTVFEMTARKKQLPLIAIMEAGTPLTVMGDPERIRQVVINLLSNALKFTAVGRISLNVSMTDQILDEHLVLRIEVRDTGIGIGDEDKARLFLPFSQIENGRLINDEGTGLGLMICRQIVGLMNGDIGVQSELGKGSVFWFTVPFKVPEDCELSDNEQVIELFDNRDSMRSIFGGALRSSIERGSLEQELEVSTFASGSRILVAEDNDINCKVILGYLERMGLVPDVVKNGQQVLDKFQKEGKQYDLILMDCEMPVLDGFSATEALYQWQDDIGGGRTPVIALSAHVTEGHIQRSRDVGMLMHVAKPLSFQRFSEALNDALGCNAC